MRQAFGSGAIGFKNSIPSALFDPSGCGRAYRSI
jgi:hypothetical protein